MSDYYLDLDSGDFFAKNFSLFDVRRRVRLYGEEHIDISSPFPLAPFESLNDFQNKLKAPLAIPITSARMLIMYALNLAKNAALFLINLITLDFEKTGAFALKAFIDVLGLGYSAGSLIYDTSYSIISLLTQMVITGYVLVAGDADWEIEREFNDEQMGFSETFLETSCSTMKVLLSAEDGLANYLESYTCGFFQRFNSDFQTQLQAPLVAPISYLMGALHSLLSMVAQIALAALNLLVFDFSQSWIDTKVAWHYFEGAAWFVYYAVADTLYATTKLATRTIGTAVSAIGDAIERRQNPEQPEINNVLLP